MYAQEAHLFLLTFARVSAVTAKLSGKNAMMEILFQETVATASVRLNQVGNVTVVLQRRHQPAIKSVEME